MRRLLLLCMLAAGLASFSVFGLAACEGNDKPPLTPDGVEPAAETVEAGAPATSPPPSAAPTAN